LKSQYGHFFTHHGKWMYSDSGGRLASLRAGSATGADLETLIAQA
jgi:hypothetical protein